MTAFCIFCSDTGVVKDGNSFYTCPHCLEKEEYIGTLQITVANLLIEGFEEEAYELNSICNLLQDCPVLALAEAERQERPKEFLEKIMTVFGVKSLG